MSACIQATTRKFSLMRALALAISGPLKTGRKPGSSPALPFMSIRPTRDRHEIGNAHDIVADVVIEPGIERRLRANIGVHQHGSVGGSDHSGTSPAGNSASAPFAQHAVQR